MYVTANILNKRKRNLKEAIKPVVLNMGSIESQGFVESVSGVRQRSRFLRPFFEVHVLIVLFFEHSDSVCN